MYASLEENPDSGMCKVSLCLGQIDVNHAGVFCLHLLRAEDEDKLSRSIAARLPRSVLPSRM